MQHYTFNHYLTSIVLFLLLITSLNTTRAQSFKKGYNYTLTSEKGRIIGHFQEAIGLPTKSPTKIFRASGPVKFSNIILKKGFISSRRHYNWYQSTRIGRVIQKNLVLQKYDDRGNLIREWTIQGAYPFEASGFVINPNGTGRATFLKYKLEQCLVTSYSTSRH